MENHILYNIKRFIIALKDSLKDPYPLFIYHLS